MLQDESKLLGSQVNCETPLIQNNIHVAVNSCTTEDLSINKKYQISNISVLPRISRKKWPLFLPRVNIFKDDLPWEKLPMVK